LFSNRPYRRLEINISPTNQRTEPLSNRPQSGVIWSQTDPSHWRQFKRSQRDSYPYGAGWNLSRAKSREPRHKQRLLSLPAACALFASRATPRGADSIAQSSPHGVAVRAFPRGHVATHHSPPAAALVKARKRSIATFTSLRFGLTCSKHRTSENFNRNKIALFQNTPSARQPRRRQDASGTTEERKPKSAGGGDRMAA
jgi:hypothetical protein